MSPTNSTRSRTRLGIAALALIVLSGCATLSSDGGFGPVEQTAKDRLGKDVKWAVPMLTVMPSISVLLNCWSNHCRPTTPSRSPL